MTGVVSQQLLGALQEMVVGQEYALTAVTRAVVRALGGTHNRGPVSVLLFAGPTGSGKTHVVRSLATVLFGDERKVIYINCHQLRQASDTLLNFHEQLIGGLWRSLITPPYGLLPISILVLEEIDKAPEGFLDTLAASIDRGWILSKGLPVEIGSLLFVLTVTLSKKQVDQLVGRSIGFFVEGEAELDLSKRHLLVLDEMDHMLGSHLVGRTDEIVLFETLTAHHIMTFLDKRLAALEQLMALYGVRISLEPPAKQFLASQGTEDLTHGMRQINRVFKNMIEFPLSDLLLSQRLTPGSTVRVSYEAPRAFLNFQILTPWLVPPDCPLFEPIELAPSVV
jgi:ATP-dependent Clp protease ATP-binding subunit ClpA